MVSELWVEKYRPKTVDDYVFRDERLKEQVKTWIQDKSIPHILMHGPAGTGKSSLARVLINELNIDPVDLMYVNMSDQTGVDHMRGQIQTFVSTISMGEFKVVLLEESDYATPNAQGALRRIMEDYAESARFILTANYPHKIIPAIKSRTQEIVIQKLDEDAFKFRIIEILANEDIGIDDEDTIDTYIRASYPDLRKCINTIQLNCQNGHLLNPIDNEASSADWQIKAIDLFKKGSILEARELIVSQIRPEEYDDLFRLCYRNLNWWGSSVDQQDEALIIIRDSMVYHQSVADPEINISAMFASLSRISK